MVVTLWNIWTHIAASGPLLTRHEDVIKWKHFPRYWPFVRGINRSPVNSPHKGQWRGALMSSLICTWINDWVNNRQAGDLRRHRAHYDDIVMLIYTHTYMCIYIKTSYIYVFPPLLTSTRYVKQNHKTWRMQTTQGIGTNLCGSPANERPRYKCNVVSHWLGAYTKWYLW